MKMAGATPGNALPPEHENLIAGIETLKSETRGERILLAEARDVADATGTKQRQIDELSRRLDEVEKQLIASKSKAMQVEQVNAVNVDPASVIVLIRDALQVFRHGIDLLDDNRFTETLRRAAKATRRTGRRYIEAVRQRFAILKLPWWQGACI